MSELSDATAVGADTALRNAVTLAADDHLDLAAALRGAEAIQGSLVSAFERRLKSLLPAQDRPAWLEPLMHELAVLQSDQFVIRAALAKHGQAMPAYRDALLVLREALATEAAVLERPPFRLRVDLGPNTLGYGWHPPERTGGSPWFRMSGPSTNSGLLVPTAGSGDYQVTIRVKNRIPGNAEAMRIRVNGVEPRWNQTVKGEQFTFQGVFTAAPQGAQRFFALLEWEVPRCPPLSDFGGDDRRRAGFALDRILLEHHEPGR